MRAVLTCLLLLCLVAATPSFGVYLPGYNNGAQYPMPVKGRFGVMFSEQAQIDNVTKNFDMVRVGIPSIDNILDKYEVADMRRLIPTASNKSSKSAVDRVFVISIPDDVDDEMFKNAMRANPYVVEIDNDMLCRLDAMPGDPSFSSQWALYQASRKDIHTTEAWDIEVGVDQVKIAIIDSGVNYKHPDLVRSIWVNPAEDIDHDQMVFDIGDSNYVDEDGNGYRDDLIGYDFFTGGSLPAWTGEDGAGRDIDPNDFNGHGTHCSGIAAAVTNSSTGGAGVAGGWGPYIGDGGARIMCLRAGYSANDGGQEVGLVLTSAVVEAITYAARNGADVISYSAGSSSFPGMATALGEAMDSGIVMAASAGNEDCDCPDYFGLYSGILAVAATNRYDARWRWYAGAGSNYGTWVEVSAPGQDIYSTYSNHYTPAYATLTGTSMAAPHVAGLAALLKSHYPDMDKWDMDTLIMNTTDNIDAENPSFVGLLGTGRINAYNALQNSPVVQFDGSPRRGPAPLTVDFVDQSPATISRLWDFGDGGSSTDETPSHEFTAPGLYDVSLEVTDPNGTLTHQKKYFIHATADTVYGDSITVLGSSGSTAYPVPIYIKNTVPVMSFTLVFDWVTEDGTADLDFSHVDLTGTRGEQFDTAIVRAIATSTGKVAIEFIATKDGTNDELPVGDGPIANIYFDPSGAGTIRFDTITLVGYQYEFETRYVDYVPEYKPFRVKIGLRGDANNDGAVNAGDPVYLIAYVFKGGPAPASTYHGDANADGSVNVADAVYLINYIFKGGPPPPP